MILLPRREGADNFDCKLICHPFCPVNWETGTCINDGKQPKWEKDENLFRYKEECCSYKFEYKFDTCMGPPTYEPTKAPANDP